MTALLPTAQPDEVRRQAAAVITHHGKSFALAARLLPAPVRDDAHVLYAFCRRADDAVDESPAAERVGRLEALRAEIGAVYGETPPHEPILAALQDVVRKHQLPRACFDELLAGMAMDVQGVRYVHMEQLLQYAYRVAGTVGLMMCHVMGTRSHEALRRAADLGIAMQLTNIARDVAEDWGRGRMYLPEALLARHGLMAGQLPLGELLPRSATAPLAGAIAELLRSADQYYASSDEGLAMLPARLAFGVRAARRIYAEIGRVLRQRGCDPLSGRAVVSLPRKLWLVAAAAVETGREALRARLRAASRGSLRKSRS